MLLPWPSFTGRMMAAARLDSEVTTAVSVEHLGSPAGSPSMAIRACPLATLRVTCDSTRTVTRIVPQYLVKGPFCRSDRDGTVAEGTRISERTGNEVI